MGSRFFLENACLEAVVEIRYADFHPTGVALGK